MRLLSILGLFIFSLNSYSEVRLISVDGNVEKSYKANIISFNLLVWGKGLTAREAQKSQSEESIRVKKIITKFNIEQKDFMSSAYDLNPDYTYDPKTSQNTIVGYHANEILTIVLRKIDEAGKFIDEVANAKEKSGGVNINGLNWDIDNREDMQKSLMSDAVSQALLKAEILAKAAHVTIKKVFRISPVANNIYNPPMMNMKSMNVSAMAESQTSLQSGQVKVTSTINIDYEIE